MNSAHASLLSGTEVHSFALHDRPRRRPSGENSVPGKLCCIAIEQQVFDTDTKIASEGIKSRNSFRTFDNAVKKAVELRICGFNELACPLLKITSASGDICCNFGIAAEKRADGSTLLSTTCFELSVVASKPFRELYTRKLTSSAKTK